MNRHLCQMLPVVWISLSQSGCMLRYQQEFWYCISLSIICWYTGSSRWFLPRFLRIGNKISYKAKGGNSFVVTERIAAFLYYRKYVDCQISQRKNCITIEIIIAYRLLPGHNQEHILWQYRISVVSSLNFHLNPQQYLLVISVSEVCDRPVWLMQAVLLW